MRKAVAYKITDKVSPGSLSLSHFFHSITMGLTDIVAGGIGVPVEAFRLLLTLVAGK